MSPTELNTRSTGMRNRLLVRGCTLSVALTLMLLLVSFEPHGAGRAESPVPGQSTTLLPDGRVLVLGGEGAQGPTGAVGLLDPRTGVTTALPPLQQARAWHTATVLPDGTVLVFGGVTASGRPTATAEVIDPAAGTVTASGPLGLEARAGHTATLLTDGRVLVAGGEGTTGAPAVSAELWDPATGSVTPAPSTLASDRTRHTALLMPDGSVLLSGGTTRAGAALATAERLDPTALTVTQEPTPPAVPGPSDVPQVAATMPAADAAGVAGDIRVALRLSKPVDPASVHGGAVTLAGTNGPEAVTVVAAEGGRLLFLTPKAPLALGATYAVTLNGVLDTDGQSVAFTSTRFTTAAPPTATVTTTAAAAPHVHSAAPEDPDEHSHLPKVRPRAGTTGELDDLDWRGTRDKGGRPESRWQELPPMMGRPGETALSGQVLRLNGEPLANVTFAIGGAETRSDRTGRFLLRGVPTGRQGLLMDGSTANAPGRTYGSFFPGVDIVAGKTTVLPWTVWMPVIDMAHAVELPVPTTGPMVVTSPRIPGLEVHIPGNVILQTSEGPLTVMSLTRLSTERPPFPVPEGAKFLWTPQAHGAQVLKADGTPSPVGVRFILPNIEEHPPGARVDLWGHSVAKGWYVYGQGTVSADGKQIVPDPGVQFLRVTCIFLGQTPSYQVVTNPATVRADPVDVSTGLYTMEKTDLMLPDVIPIVLQRQHRSGDTSVGLFGMGQHDLYSMTLTSNPPSYTVVDLILGNGARVHFEATNPGDPLGSRIFEHTNSPTDWQKARVTYLSANDHWLVTRKDGVQYEFSGHWGSYLLAIRDPRGNQLTIDRVYTPPPLGDWARYSRWPLRITAPNGRRIEFTVDTTTTGQEVITQALDVATGRTVSYTYDGSKRLTLVTDAAGGMTSYTYDGTSQRIATITDPKSLTWLTNTYDGNGRVTQQTNADSTTYQFAYTLDGNGKVTQTDVTDPRGNVERLTFNGAGHVLTATRAYGTALAQTTTYTRDSTTNLPTRITAALGRNTDFTYDSSGNVLTVTRLAGTGNAVTTTATYTSAYNQLATLTDPLSHTTTFAYDAVGNLTTVTDPLSHTTTLTYDAQGNVLTATTSLSQTTTFSYLLGDLYTITNPLGQTTTRFTDGGGRMLALTNPLGQRTRYAYDALNQLTQITDSLGGQIQFSYDGNGNLLSLTDARSNATTYAYNSMDRATSRTDPLTHAETYAYDNNGNPTTFTDRKSQVTSTTYDALDRPTLVTYQDSSTTAYTWDAGNRLTQLVDSISGTITRTYDDLNRLTQEVTPQGTISYSYDAAGRRTSMTVQGQTQVTYTYDNADRLTQITQGSTTVTIAYDNANRRTSLTLPNGVVTEYAYDAASRLTGLTYKLSGTPIGTLTYAYDAAGNRTEVGGTWARTALPTAPTSATYNAANQQTAFGGTTQTFDLNGNMTSDGTVTYTWDARNQLVSLTGGSTANFQYDPQGRRTSKTINSTQVGFLYDGLNPIEELNGSTPTANLLIGLGIDEYLTRTDSTGTRAYLTEALGSTVALTDNSGTVEASYTYEPFGATSTAGTPGGNSFDYTGREDDGTGLKYYRARYYHPGRGRFLSEDPVGFAAGDANLFAYTFNKPTDFRDPTGNVVPAAALVLGAACVGGAPFGIASVAVMVGRKPTLPEATYGAALGCGMGMMTVVSAGAAAVGAGAGVAVGAGGGAVTGVAAAGWTMLQSAGAKLERIASKFGTTTDALLEQAAQSNARYTDTLMKNSGNINVFIQRPDGAAGFVRVTLDPSGSRVISTGLMRATQVGQGIINGRFVQIP
jgi:RHS repeat-associated protein